MISLNFIFVIFYHKNSFFCGMIRENGDRKTEKHLKKYENLQNSGYSFNFEENTL